MDRVKVIAVVVTARPSYAKCKTIIQGLLDKGAYPHVIACASALLERYGKVVDVIRKDFPQVALTEVWSTLEGANLITSAKETGTLLCELASILSRLRPDAVVAIADRHEVLAAAQAAAYQHIRLVHIQGGERTGSIDDRVRDSITQLSDLHLVATKRAALRVYGLTGEHDSVIVTGCPSIDIAKAAKDEAPVTAQELGGSGPQLDLSFPFVTVLQHPVTNEPESGAQMEATLEAISRINLPRLVFWPGEDAGQEPAAKAIRVWKERRPDLAIHTVRNLPPSRFLKLLTQSAVLAGNSSCGIRECSYLGVPVVNIGTRQQGRERARNVLDVFDHDPVSIQAAIEEQIAHGPYVGSTLYGQGDAGERIAEVLCQSQFVKQ